MTKKREFSIFWHRRDFRINDNTGLYHCLKEQKNVLPIFIFDTEILHKIANKSDARVSFIHEQLQRLKTEYNKLGSTLAIYFGKPLDVFTYLCEKQSISAVYTNHDYEPYARRRDGAVRDFLVPKGIQFRTYKDNVIFERLNVCKDDGKPYTVFTPYSRKWKALLREEDLVTNKVSDYSMNLLEGDEAPWIELSDIGFEKSTIDFPDNLPDLSVIDNYAQKRDYPSIRSTTRLGVHLRFGTVSIREMVSLARIHSEVWLSELIWREFYMMILWNFPRVIDRAFKPAYDQIPWKKNEDHFKAWCEGKTGYPIVDAGMRELNETGFMHNRVRMVAASFLTKHLLLDWRLGEAYFAEKLLDFELASNNGGWQWAASTGCDAAPYFRVFNPELQFKKFDNHAVYVKKWVPEYGSPSYPLPIVDHATARKLAIKTYAKALEKH